MITTNSTQKQKIDVKTLWKGVVAELELMLSPNYFKMWIEVAKAENLTETSIDIICPSDHVKRNIEKRVLTILQEKINEIGEGTYKINFIVRADKPVEETKKGLNTIPLFEELNTVTRSVSKDAAKDIAIKAGLSPKFTFESYLMGSNNHMAYAIATAIAENPGKLYNPFFIYSGVGLGKTHLMHAIGNRILEKNPNTKLIYCSSETFTNELIESLQKGKRGGKYTANEFRDKYRKADVLLIDDIQFIAGREATQEEFFHTFNALQMTQRQIVVTSDRPPKDFKNIEERLTSRFGAGIIADMQAPDLDMRVAILRSKRDLNKDPMPNDVIDFIAENIATNIRELEGAYLQVLTRTRTQGLDVTKETAAEALGQSIKEKKQRPLNLNEILKAVCNYYSVNMSDVKGERRTKDLVIPRQVAMYLIKDLTEMPYIPIGEFLGGRDHTTIMYGVEKIGKEYQTHPKIRQDVINIKQNIYND